MRVNSTSCLTRFVPLHFLGRNSKFKSERQPTLLKLPVCCLRLYLLGLSICTPSVGGLSSRENDLIGSQRTESDLVVRRETIFHDLKFITAPHTDLKYPSNCYQEAEYYKDIPVKDQRRKGAPNSAPATGARAFALGRNRRIACAAGNSSRTLFRRSGLELLATNLLA